MPHKKYKRPVVKAFVWYEQETGEFTIQTEGKSKLLNNLFEQAAKQACEEFQTRRNREIQLGKLDLPFDAKLRPWFIRAFARLFPKKV